MTARNTEFIGVRLPANLRKILQEYIILDTHMSESEFVRAAIREKLQREAPQLKARMMRINGQSQLPEQEA